MGKQPAKEWTYWESAFKEGRSLGYDYGESCDRADHAVRNAYARGELVPGDNSTEEN